MLVLLCMRTGIIVIDGSHVDNNLKKCVYRKPPDINDNISGLFVACMTHTRARAHERTHTQNTHTHTHTHIYIYIERERERNFLQP